MDNNNDSALFVDWPSSEIEEWFTEDGWHLSDDKRHELINAGTFLSK